MVTSHPVGGPEQIARGGYGSYTGPEPKDTRPKDCLVSLRTNQRGSDHSVDGIPALAGQLLELTMNAYRKQ